VCALETDSTPTPERLTIGAAGVVDPGHAPVSTNDAERFVFRQVFETLVLLDCAGAVRPGLAESWLVEDDGRQWTFTIRSGARFSDGTPVTGQVIADSWTRRVGPLPGGTPVFTISGRELTVRLSQPVTARLFAAPGLAVTRPVEGNDWPVGTGAYAADTSGGRVMVAPFGATGRPVLVLRPSGGGDERDLLDAGIDLLVTDDPSTLGYARSRPEFTTAALPWERRYVLAVPGGAVSLDPTILLGLARDALRVEARPSSGTPWWADPGAAACGVAPPPGTPPLSMGTSITALVYPAGDAAARDLAGRLVALGIGGAPRALGLAAPDFSAALASGRATGYVLPLPTVALEACGALRQLIARVPWLADDPARHLTPLVESRRRAIVRRGGAAFTVEWDGTLRVR
jgi:hypothetical protein